MTWVNCRLASIKTTKAYLYSFDVICHRFSVLKNKSSFSDPQECLKPMLEDKKF